MRTCVIAQITPYTQMNVHMGHSHTCTYDTPKYAVIPTHVTYSAMNTVKRWQHCTKDAFHIHTYNSVQLWHHHICHTAHVTQYTHITVCMKLSTCVQMLWQMLRSTYESVSSWHHKQVQLIWCQASQTAKSAVIVEVYQEMPNKFLHLLRKSGRSQFFSFNFSIHNQHQKHVQGNTIKAQPKHGNVIFKSHFFQFSKHKYTLKNALHRNNS